jgi:hypothetical protein
MVTLQRTTSTSRAGPSDRCLLRVKSLSCIYSGDKPSPEKKQHVLYGHEPPHCQYHICFCTVYHSSCAGCRTVIPCHPRAFALHSLHAGLWRIISSVPLLSTHERRPKCVRSIHRSSRRRASTPIRRSIRWCQARRTRALSAGAAPPASPSECWWHLPRS